MSENSNFKGSADPNQHDQSTRQNNATALDYGLADENIVSSNLPSNMDVPSDEHQLSIGADNHINNPTWTSDALGTQVPEGPEYDPNLLSALDAIDTLADFTDFPSENTIPETGENINNTSSSSLDASPPASSSTAQGNTNRSSNSPLVSEILKNRKPTSGTDNVQDQIRIQLALAKYSKNSQPPLGPNNITQQPLQALGVPGNIERPSFDLGYGQDAESWMVDVDSATNLDNPEQANAEFLRAKALIEEKRKNGTATLQDDLNLIQLQRDERCRLQRLNNQRIAAASAAAAATSSIAAGDTPDGSQDEEGSNGLFIPETPRPSRKRKAQRDDTSRPTRRKDKLTTAEIRESRVRNDGLEKSKRKTRSRKDEGSSKKAKSSKGEKKQKKKKSGPVMSNINSLWSSNVVRDAQGNENLGAIPGFTSGNKAEALKQLISSVPNAEKSGMMTDKDAILEATKKFTLTVKSDKMGGWKLKSMKSSLFHHQLLGAGWLRDRENNGEKPLGGIVADEMGFGKTIQMIANIMDDRESARASNCRTTLIVSPSLSDQWMSEFFKHCDEKSVGRILKYSAGSRIESTDVIEDLKGYDCILTSYHEVMRSYPDFDPPPQYTTEKAVNEWWKAHFTEKAGPLHKIRFRRIVLDEAHIIKNPQGKISKSIRALTGRFRWAITGSPMLNRAEELFAYFDFLKVPNAAGNYNLFKENFCHRAVNRGSRANINPERLRSFLQAIMLRRTHTERLFERPIVSLPGIDFQTVCVEFNAVERFIYEFIRTRFIQRINRMARNNDLETNYRCVLVMMQRLRMVTAHIFLIQNTLKSNLTAEDIESLWRTTANEEGHSSSDVDCIEELQCLIKARGLAKRSTGNANPSEDDVRLALRQLDENAKIPSGGRFALTFKFREFLRLLSKNSSWAELHDRSICHVCKSPPEDPWVTSCFHIYCRECLEAVAIDQAQHSDQTTCLVCAEVYDGTSPCKGLQELGWSATIDKDKRKKSSKSGGKKHSRGPNTTQDLEDDDEDDELDWIEASPDLLPSAKTRMMKAQVLEWLRQAPQEKILLFTQWLDMIRILEKICQMEKWGYVSYHGKIDLSTRQRNVKTFEQDPACKIMICSIKAGGVGLNLACASRVMILDLAWNTAIERQAFCRTFRIGQTKKVEIVRLVAKDTIDEYLLRMQMRKDSEIDSIMGDEVRNKFASLKRLLELFGTVGESEDEDTGRPFIYIEDDEESSDEEGEVRVPRRST